MLQAEYFYVDFVIKSVKIKKTKGMRRPKWMVELIFFFNFELNPTK
jgi:hypothetical protein